jgi:hypothetical protein
MSSSPEEFREFADECLTWAKTARSNQKREVFLQKARTWIEATAAVEGKRGGPGCLNNFSASISGASAEVRLPSGRAAVCNRLDRASCRQGSSVGVVHYKSRVSLRWKHGRR